MDRRWDFRPITGEVNIKKSLSELGPFQQLNLKKERNSKMMNDFFSFREGPKIKGPMSFRFSSNFGRSHDHRNEAIVDG